MEIKENFDLLHYNTFAVPARARFFVELENEAQVKDLFTLPQFKENKKLFIGGGSNVLFTRDWDGIVILNKLVGIEISYEDAQSATVRAQSGEVWHNLVSFAAARGWWGIENLSLIPGSVGAAPMQNIGAYGAELKETLESVEAYDIETGEKKVFSRAECRLGYRDSIFKREWKDKYFISAIVLRLSKEARPNLSYKVLREFLEQNNISPETPGQIADAVARIRRSKLPDPAVIGNAGSFFKNVFVSRERLAELMQAYPTVPYFEEEGEVKIPAAWFIEACGPRDGTSWKGATVGRAGVHERQALVLVNRGGATGAEIKNLAEAIIASVKEKFDITLSPEVNLI